MSTVEQSINVNVPVRAAYNQWTQFERFPEFMKDVERIEQLNDTMVRWHVSMAGVKRTFDTKITEQIPDQRVAWTTLPDAETKQAGVVTFHHIDDNQTRIMLQMDIEPNDAMEKIGDTFGLIESGIKRDLEHFKAFIEEHGRETGAWRGEV
ncbi:MAG: SRPBCC family protein [Nitriliruptoraceae bacterium]